MKAIQEQIALSRDSHRRRSALWWYRKLIFVLAFSGVGTLEIIGQPIAPQFLSAAALDGEVFLQWHNADAVSDHLIEYRESGNAVWSIFDHAPSSAPGVRIPGLANDIEHEFRVSAWHAGELSSPAMLSGIMPSSHATQRWCEVVLSTGQSLAIGTYSYPVLSNAQPNSNVVHAPGGGALVPLVEPAAGLPFPSGETMSSGLLNTLGHFDQFDGHDKMFAVCISAAGAMPYSSLMEGTTIYDNLMRDLDSTKKRCLELGRPAIVRALTVVHGETDEYQGVSADQYEQHLLEWQSDVRADVLARTGQVEDMILMTDQMSSWMSFGSTVPHTALGQYQAIGSSGGAIQVVTPKYIFDSVDWLSHLTNYSSRRLGEYYAKAYRSAVTNGIAWRPVMPEAITIDGSTIIARFHVPMQPLELDTFMVSKRPHYGFEYFDDCVSATIQSVAVTGPDEVTISLTNAPQCSNARLRYAHTGVVGAWTGRHVNGAIGGNLRDSDSTPALFLDALPDDFDVQLRNWCMSFDQPVSFAASSGQQSTNKSFEAHAYPNPSNGELTVRCPDFAQEDAGIVVTDMFGRVVLFERVHCRGGGRGLVDGWRVDLTGQPSGVYQIVLTQRAKHVRIPVVLE